MSSTVGPAVLHRAYRLGVVAAAAALFTAVSVATAGNGTGSSGGDNGGAQALAGAGDTSGNGGAQALAGAGDTSGSAAGGAAGGAAAGAGAGAGATGAGGSAGAAGGVRSGGSVNGGAGGRAGGAAGGAGGTAGGGTAVTGPARNDQGVSDKQIDVGFVYVPDSFYNQYGVTPQHEDVMIKAFAQYVNAHGGINGRAMNAVPQPDGDDTNASGGDSACRSLVNDSHVFMLVDQGQIGVSDCAVRSHRPLVSLGTSSFVSLTATQINNGSPYIWSLAPPLETQIEQWVEFLADVEKDQGQTYGLLYFNVDYGIAGKTAFEADASKHGLKCCSDYALSIDPSQVGTECPSIATQFRRDGVTKAAIIGGAEGAGVFVNCLNGQQENIKYTFSAVGGAARTDYGDFFPSSYVGTRGTSFEHAASADSGPQQTCRAALQQYAQGGATYGTVAEQYCEMIFLTWKALSAINPASGYNTSTFAAAMSGIQGFPANDTDVLNFSASKHSGADTSLVLEYEGRQTFAEKSGFQRSF